MFVQPRSLARTSSIAKGHTSMSIRGFPCQSALFQVLVCVDQVTCGVRACVERHWQPHGMAWRRIARPSQPTLDNTPQMVYLKHWSEFHAQAIDLYKRKPGRVSDVNEWSETICADRFSTTHTQTRYLIKSHPSRQWLVLKVTDDVQVRCSAVA